MSPISVPGPGTDMPIAMVTPSGGSNTRKYFHTNRQGSTIAMSADDGTMAEGPYTYDAYGNGAPATGVPFKYTGRRLDAGTGLYYYRARYYSAALGRFLQVDPVGYQDQMNLYGYVNSDPANATDPTGEFAQVALFTLAGGMLGGAVAAITHVATNAMDKNPKTNTTLGGVAAAFGGGFLSGASIGLTAATGGLGGGVLKAAGSSGLLSAAASAASDVVFGDGKVNLTKAGASGLAGLVGGGGGMLVANSAKASAAGATILGSITDAVFGEATMPATNAAVEEGVEGAKEMQKGYENWYKDGYKSYMDKK